MTAKTERLNAGRPDNLPLIREGFEFTGPDAMLEQWDLHDRGPKDGFTRWKLCAAPGTTVRGKANYSLVVKDGKLWTKDDGHALKERRPELFEAIAAYAEDGTVVLEAVSTENEDDPFGDIAENRGQPLTQLQQFNRALLGMRGTEIHWASRPDRDSLPDGVVKGNWAETIRQTWFGVYRGDFNAALEAHRKSIVRAAKKAHAEKVADVKREAREQGASEKTVEKAAAGVKLGQSYSKAVKDVVDQLTSDMDNELIGECLAFITERDPDVEIDHAKFLEIRQQFFAGDFGPRRHERLADWYDYLTGLLNEEPRDDQYVASVDDFEDEGIPAGTYGEALTGATLPEGKTLDDALAESDEAFRRELLALSDRIAEKPVDNNDDLL